MTTGVEIDVADGLATIYLPDLPTRGEFLTELLAAVGPGNVRKVTRPRVGYVVPEAVLRAAGGLDDAVVEPPSATEDGTGSGTLNPTGPNADDGKPDMDWSRKAINEYAANVGVVDPEKLGNKQDVIDAIKAAEVGAPGDGDTSVPAEQHP